MLLHVLCKANDFAQGENVMKKETFLDEVVITVLMLTGLAVCLIALFFSDFRDRLFGRRGY